MTSESERLAVRACLLQARAREARAVLALDARDALSRWEQAVEVLPEPAQGVRGTEEHCAAFCALALEHFGPVLQGMRQPSGPGVAAFLADLGTALLPGHARSDLRRRGWEWEDAATVLEAMLDRSAALQAVEKQEATDLDLGGMDLQDEGFAPVAAALRSSAVLRSLNLRSNALGPDSVAALVTAMPPTLTTLGLGANGVGASGAKTMARALPDCALRSLGLEENALCSGGCVALAAALRDSRTSLTELTLDHNGLSAGDAEALAAALCVNRTL